MPTTIVTTTVESNGATIPRVLCVDDEPLNLILLESILCPRGYDVVSAHNGAEALEIIQTERIDICLLDVMMPGLNGFEICRLIKSHETDNIPVIMITAHSETEKRIQGIEAGAEDFISKPFDTDEVLARIKMLLYAKSKNDRRIQEADTTKRQFLSTMSHELRTPMHGVLGMTQLLELTELTKEQRDYIADLKKSGKNMMVLVNDILDFSSVESGKAEVNVAEFNLKQCINDTVVMQKNNANEKGLSLDVHFSGAIPDLLMGDALQLQQIVLNLLENAVKFTECGGVTITVQLFETQNSHTTSVQIAIRDTGIGILPEALTRIFLPFVQEDGSATRAYGGTGLGLTLSRRLAELMGGTLSVESTRNHGSCFTLLLPFAVKA